MDSLPVLPLLPVQPEYITWRGYRIATYRAGSGQPILLVHSINAAASAFEMRGPFAQLQADGTVYAMDLLGYGNSDRPARTYSPADYIDQIGSVLEHIGAPTVVVASSLGATYAVAAADRWPNLVRSMVLVCPVGISQLSAPPGGLGWGVHRALSGGFGRWVFRRLTTKRAQRYFLRQQAYSSSACITPETLAGFFLAAQRPGAYYAPICFVSGLLNCDIAAAYPRLRMPILLIWGRKAITTPVSKADEFLQSNARAQLKVIERASMLAQDEQPAEFAQLVREFMAN